MNPQDPLIYRIIHLFYESDAERTQRFQDIQKLYLEMGSDEDAAFKAALRYTGQHYTQAESPERKLDALPKTPDGTRPSSPVNQEVEVTSIATEETPLQPLGSSSSRATLLKETLPPQEDVDAWSNAGSDEDEDEASDTEPSSKPVKSVLSKLAERFDESMDKVEESVGKLVKESTILSSMARNLVSEGMEDGPDGGLEPDDDMSKTIKPGPRGESTSGPAGGSSSRPISVLGRQPLSGLQHKPHSSRVKSLIGGSDVE